ncbi:MAG: dihydroorotate dehydrogenase [Lachnospiraceae bacterium]|nr:dihydroorotate dehydrogenase [Lachnospiraceae bacterium]
MAPLTEVKLAGVTLKNPVLTASGTFGSGMEFSKFVDLNKLGGVVTKGVSVVPWEGNPTPRVMETASGMLNAIGLQNPGLDVFLKRDLPFLQAFDTKKIVNVCGHTTEEYVEAAEILSESCADILEINISCPNVKAGGITFGTDPKMAEAITKAIKKDAGKKPVFMKLSPNVTDITEIARAVEAGGADGISLINTLLGMKIDIRRKAFALANRTGGLSGPAIKPVAVRMVYQVANAVKLPLIGMGGIACAEDAIEFLMAGATAISVGTANFRNPKVTEEIVSGIETFLSEQKIADINDIIGCVK